MIEHYNDILHCRSWLVLLLQPPLLPRLFPMNTWRLRLSPMFTRRFQPSLMFTRNLNWLLKLLASSTEASQPQLPSLLHNSLLPQSNSNLLLPSSHSSSSHNSSCSLSHSSSLLSQFKECGTETASTTWARESHAESSLTKLSQDADPGVLLTESHVTVRTAASLVMWLVRSTAESSWLAVIVLLLVIVYSS